MEVKKHMARIAGVDLPREKRVEIGLTYIYGIGRVSADRILAEANVDPNTRCRDLTDDEVKRISEVIDNTQTVAWNTALYTDVAFVSFGEDPVFTYPLPDERDTVLKIQLRN